MPALTASRSCLTTLVCLAHAAALLVTHAALGCGDDDAGTSSSSDHGNHPDGGGAAGSRSGDPNPVESPAPGGGSFEAVIDGTPFEAQPSSVRARIDEDVPGGYMLQGTSGSQQVQLDLFYVDAPGRYVIGVGGSVVGARGSVAKVSSIWQTAASGAAGTLTITELSTKRIAGTFEMEVVPLPGSQAMGMVSVTEGQFDIALEDQARAIGPAHGRMLSAEIDGKPFYAATVVLTPYSGGLSFNALTDQYNLGFILSEVQEPGTYTLTLDVPSRGVAVVSGNAVDQPDTCCWTTGIGEAGSITFTTLSDQRLVGSFEVTLDPMAGKPATEPLVVTKGEFDIGREDP